MLKNKTISVNLKGTFVRGFYDAKKGTRVKIDKIRHDNCESGIMCHVADRLYGTYRIKWFDSNWFEFDK